MRGRGNRTGHPLEVDKDWFVSRNKGDYCGNQALIDLVGNEEVKFFGIAAEHGAELSVDGKIVGHVTTPAYSRRSGKSLALVHLLPYAALQGVLLKLKGLTIQCRAGSPHPFRRSATKVTACPVTLISA